LVQLSITQITYNLGFKIGKKFYILCLCSLLLSYYLIPKLDKKQNFAFLYLTQAKLSTHQDDFFSKNLSQSRYVTVHIAPKELAIGAIAYLFSLDKHKRCYAYYCLQ
jgi:hypothetical protein